MITSVRVRPESKWCSGAKKNICQEAKRILLRNQTLEIDTETAKRDCLQDCSEISWRLEGKSKKELLSELGPVGLRICCHVVEID